MFKKISVLSVGLFVLLYGAYFYTKAVECQVYIQIEQKVEQYS